MSKLSRFGWGTMAILFLLTFVAGALGVLISALHSNSNQNQPPTNSCAFSASVSAPKLSAPSVKPAGKISTLKSIDLTKGTGAIAQSGSCVAIKYYGFLSSTGKMFDQDYSQSTGLQFPLTQGYVIPGMVEGMVGMKVGGTRELLIPSSLGYGKQAQGSIPANSDLVFIVKLVSIK